jgi:hypothetical protein
MVSLMIALWQMAGNVTGLSMRASHMRALPGDFRTNIRRAFLTSSSVNSMILSLGCLWVDRSAVMVSGEMLRLDVFDWYEAVVASVVGVDNCWFDELMGGCWCGPVEGWSSTFGGAICALEKLQGFISVVGNRSGDLND